MPLAGKRVVLKPNLVEYHRDKVINTHPHVVAAVIELCKREGAAEVIVAEGPGHWRNVEYLVSASGLGDVLRQLQRAVRRPQPRRAGQDAEPRPADRAGYLYLSRTVATADVLISLPKLKTHHWAGATLSLKNLFGTLPGICYGWPKNELHWRGIDNSIVDIALTRTPDLAIVDGIVGMEGDGPLNGTAKHMGVLVMGATRGRGRHLLPPDEAGPRADRLPGAGYAEEAGPAPRSARSSSSARRSRTWPSRSRPWRTFASCAWAGRHNLDASGRDRESCILPTIRANRMLAVRNVSATCASPGTGCQTCRRQFYAPGNG